MIADHVLRRLRHIVLEQVVQVLVVAPGHVHLVQPAVSAVDAQFAVVAAVLAVRVGGKKLGVDDAVRVPAADREGVAHHRPLRLAKQAQHLAQVVHEAGQHKPVGVAVGADRLGGLQQVADLGQVDIRVRLVDQGIEVVQPLPGRHFPLPELQPLVFFAQHEIDRLVRVVVAIELAHPVDARLRVVAVGGAVRLVSQQWGRGQGVRHAVSSKAWVRAALAGLARRHVNRAPSRLSAKIWPCPVRTSCPARRLPGKPPCPIS